MCIILAIESSCDETSASICKNGKILTNIISSQLIHSKYGGVVPEFASRAHQRNISDVVFQAFNESGVNIEEINAIAYTQGPGLVGSLLVAASFAKGFAIARKIPIIGVDHLQAHVLAILIEERKPEFPFLCLLVSGGHTQIIKVNTISDFQILGNTIDDAAGEAFDKAAKVLGLPYPGGPWIDQYAEKGNHLAFKFPIPKIPGLNFSFSGLKTSFLYKIRDGLKTNPEFIEDNKYDLCAAYQHRIVNYLTDKLISAAENYKIKDICIAGGVAANQGLRKKLTEAASIHKLNLFIPSFQYCTDNAGMIANAAYYMFLQKQFGNLDDSVYSSK